MATCVIDTLLQTAATSGFAKLSNRDKLSVLTQLLYDAAGSSSTVDQLLTDAAVAGFSKIPSERYRIAVLLQMMVAQNGGTSSANDILAAAATSGFPKAPPGAKKDVLNQLWCDITSVDPDAQAYITRAGITDSTEISAVNQLVLDLKSSGIWAQRVAIWPYLGGTLAKATYNLASTSFDITWGGSPTAGAKGVSGDGSTAFGDTGLDPASDISGAPYFWMSSYVVDQLAGSFPQIMSQFTQRCELGCWTTTTEGYGKCGASTATPNGSLITAGNNGLISCGKESGTDNNRLYNQTTEIDSAIDATSSLSAGTNIFLLCRDTSGSKSLFCSSGDFIGISAIFNGNISDYITDWSAAVTTFATTLGRNI